MCVTPISIDSGSFRGRRVPCSKCVECGLSKSRTWAVRCMHEASVHSCNSYVTLTYSDEFLPVGGSLDGPIPFPRPGAKPGAFAEFVKRLRARREVESVRYFHAGEYGADNQRPHYHALLFGVDFPDKVQVATRQGFPIFGSSELEDLWPFGFAEIGSVTFESAQYVAKYCVKKALAGGKYGFGDNREREYITMSRRPGIGSEWVSRFAAEVVRFGSVMLRDVEVDVPRFYVDKLSEAQQEVIKARRARKHGERVQKALCGDANELHRGSWRERAAREILAVQKLRMAEAER